MSIELPYSLPCENVTPMVAVGLGLLRDPARPGAAGARPERDESDRKFGLTGTLAQFIQLRWSAGVLLDNDPGDRACPT